MPDFMKRRAELRWTRSRLSAPVIQFSPIFCTACRATLSGTAGTRMLVLPDDVPAHPLQTSIDVASLAPNAEITVFPWKEPAELKERTIDRVRISYLPTSRCVLRRNRRAFTSPPRRFTLPKARSRPFSACSIDMQSAGRPGDQIGRSGLADLIQARSCTADQEPRPSARKVSYGARHGPEPG